MANRRGWFLLVLLLVPTTELVPACSAALRRDDVFGCGKMVGDGFRRVAGEPTGRFLGKVAETTASCRGGDHAHAIPLDAVGRLGQLLGRPAMRRAGLRGPASPFRGHATAASRRRAPRPRVPAPSSSSSSTCSTTAAPIPDYVRGWQTGHIPNVWNEMRLPSGDPTTRPVGGDVAKQHCTNELVRFGISPASATTRRNPAMGSSNSVCSARQRGLLVDVSRARRRRADAQSTRRPHRLMTPDPQVISRRLFTRPQSHRSCARTVSDSTATRRRPAATIRRRRS